MLRWLKNLLMSKNKRLELIFITYENAEKLLASPDEKWQIAKEEDANRFYGMVWLERLENE